MTDTTHTPGPWGYLSVGDPDECRWLVGSIGRLAHATVQSRPAPHLGGDPVSEEEAFANARLIAAAPDLLEALIEMASGHSMVGEAKARAAIAKATGN